MRTLRYMLLAGLLGAAFSAQAAPVTYKLDPGHTMVLFSWSHFGFSHPTANIGLGEIGEGHRVEVVVGERDEAESAAPQLDDLGDNGIDGPLAWRLTVGPPD